jgi:hypothetical protein
VSRSTLYEWMKNAGLPSLKVKGCRRFDPDEVAVWEREHDELRESSATTARVHSHPALRPGLRPRHAPPVVGAGNRERLRSLRGAH